MQDEVELSETQPTAAIDPPEAARTAIWDLFEHGMVDEDMATAGLLALDIGLRRSGRQAADSSLARPNGGPS